LVGDVWADYVQVEAGEELEAEGEEFNAQRAEERRREEPEKRREEKRREEKKNRTVARRIDLAD
jgi:hypothetical protein